MGSIERFYRTTVAPPGESEGYDTKDLALIPPDLIFSKFSKIEVDKLAGLGAPHVLLDVDGTLIARSGSAEDGPGKKVLWKIGQIACDSRFKTVGLATENGGNPDSMLRTLGMPETTGVFQPWSAGKLGMSWKTTERFLA